MSCRVPIIKMMRMREATSCKTQCNNAWGLSFAQKPSKMLPLVLFLQLHIIDSSFLILMVSFVYLGFSSEKIPCRP